VRKALAPGRDPIGCRSLGNREQSKRPDQSPGEGQQSGRLRRVLRGPTRRRQKERLQPSGVTSNRRTPPARGAGASGASAPQTYVALHRTPLGHPALHTRCESSMSLPYVGGRRWSWDRPFGLDELDRGSRNLGSRHRAYAELPAVVPWGDNSSMPPVWPRGASSEGPGSRPGAFAVAQPQP
jgi:hypothetical protein